MTCGVVPTARASTNRQLLFHMVFGYVIVRTLLPLVHVLGRLGYSRQFAALLNACRRPFHLINYLGSCGGGPILTPQAMVALLDRTVRALHRNLSTETEQEAWPDLHFPTAWDPYFKPTMSVLDVYHFGTQHFIITGVNSRFAALGVGDGRYARRCKVLTDARGPSYGHAVTAPGPDHGSRRR